MWLGGMHDWEYGQHPDLDAELRRMVSGRLVLDEQWPEGPLQLVEGRDGVEIVSPIMKGRERIVGSLVGRGRSESMSEDE